MKKYIVIFTIIYIVVLAHLGMTFAQSGNLLAYYPFNGNANDESGNGNHGTVVGATLVQDRFGNSNSAYSFNGLDNYIGFPVLWNSSPDSVSLLAWFNVDSSQPDGKILYHGDNGEVQLFIGGDSARAGVHLGQNVNDPWYYVRGFYLQNEWQMITAIWIKGESLRLYLNSNLVDSVGVSIYELLDPGSGYQPSIGSYGRTLGAFYNGMIDDIRIYGRALNVSEIDLLYNEGTSAVELIGSATPEEYILNQNYPNPFNPSTTIGFSIPEESYVSFKIYNLLGEEIETVVHQELSTGNYKYNWNATDLPSGIYYYTLKTHAASQTKKMILIK